MRHPRVRVAAVVAALIGLTGCAGAPPPAPASTGTPTAAPVAAAPHTSWDVSDLPDPCRMLTDAEARTIIGGEVSVGRRLESWPPLCQFVLGSPQGYLYLSDDSADTGKADFDRHRGDSTATQAVSGLGDQAYWLPDFSALHILSGPTHVMISFGGTTPPADAKNKAVSIARLALPRVA
jgi:hypothetical protein